jgi:hypothetical protein
MKQLIFISIFLLISFGIVSGNTWNSIKDKTWIAKKDFPTNQYVFFETTNGLKKAVFQINGSGRCAVLSLIYDVEMNGDTIILKNELKLDNSILDIRESIKTSKTLYISSESTIVSIDLSFEYNKAFNDARICNWLETYSGYQIIPFEKFKSIPIEENQIYDRSSFIFGPNLENCGIDNNPLLTVIEANFLNEYMNEIAKEKKFDFNEKRIVFATGSGGGKHGSKTDYFDNIREWYEKNNSKIATSLIVLNETERLEYGFDAIVTYWVKVLTPKTTKKLLENTKKY